MENSWGKKRKAFILQVQKELELALAFVWQMLRGFGGNRKQQRHSGRYRKLELRPTATAESNDNSNSHGQQQQRAKTVTA